MNCPYMKALADFQQQQEGNFEQDDITVKSAKCIFSGFVDVFVRKMTLIIVETRKPILSFIRI